MNTKTHPTMVPPGSPARPLPLTRDTFAATVCGIPCYIEVLSYLPGSPDGFMEPGDPAEIEWQLLDQRGRPAAWLERKLTDTARDALEQKAIDFMERRRGDV